MTVVKLTLSSSLPLRRPVLDLARAMNRPLLLVLFAIVAGAVAYLAFAESSDEGPAPSPGGATDVRDEGAGAERSAGARGSSAPAQRRALVGPYGAAAGTVLRYRVDMQGTSELGATNAVGNRFVGPLEILILERGSDAIWASVAAPGIDVVEGVATAMSPHPQLAADLGRPTLVQFAVDGRLRSVRPDPDCSPAHRPFLASILACLQFAVESGAETWERDEREPTGTAKVVYRGSFPDAVRRERVRVVSAGDGSDLEIVSSEGEARFDPATGWVATARFDETLRLTIPEVGQSVSVTTRFVAELEEVARIAPVPTFDKTGMLGPAALHDRDGRSDLLEWQAQQVAGISSAELIADLAQFTDPASVHSEECRTAVRRLAWAISANPAMVGELTALLVSGSLGDQTAALLLGAMGRSGVPEAQDALLDVALSAARSDALRYSATRSLFQVRTPTAASLQGLQGLLAQGAAPPAVRGVARLAAGALLGRVTEPAARDALLEALIGSEPSAAADGGELLDWFEALGNTGDPAVVPLVERHLADSDPQVRAASLVMLRRLPAATQAAVIGARVLSDASDFVRLSALDLLGANVSDPGVRALVERIAASDASEQLRERARAMLR